MQFAFGQAPQIAPEGVVNAASYAQPITPGSLVSIFGTNLASATATATGIPLPKELAGTTVTIDGVQAPLLFVSSGQINLEAPAAMSSCDGCPEFGSATFVITTARGSSGSVSVPTSTGSPGIFTADGSGCGQAVALNMKADGSVSLNSPSNSAAPGDYIEMFGTGLGLAYFPPPDGSAPDKAQALEYGLGLSLGFLGGNIPSSGWKPYLYAGLAPGLVGVQQMDFKIPPGAPQGCSVPVLIQSQIFGPVFTLSIHNGGGHCSDPPIQSSGQITLLKTISSGTSADGETDSFTASFPSGPGMPPPQPLAPAPSPNSYIGNILPPSFVPFPGPTRSCSVAGYTDLSAGTITITSANASAAAKPLTQIGGVAYQQALPVGFVSPGNYKISTDGGPVQFQELLSVPAPIQIQPGSLAPGTAVSSSNAFTVNWTGGDPGALVTVFMIAGTGLSARADYTQASAAVGSATFEPLCSGNPISAGGNGVFCTFGFTGGPLEVVVDVTPDPSKTVAVSAQGITGGVQATWDYRYIFDGLTLKD